MALKAVVKKLDEVPEALREHYTEDNGQFVLQTDAEEKTREFRTNNVKLLKDVEGYKTQVTELQGKLTAFGEVTPDQVKDLLAKKAQLDDKNLLQKGEVEQYVEKKLAEQQKGYENRIGALETKLKETEADLVRTRITDELTKTATKGGVDPELLEDAVFLASREWLLEGGVAVRKVNGEVVLSADNPGKNQTMPEYWTEVSQKKPKFFLDSGGGGSRQGDRPGSGSVKTIPNDPREIGLHAEAIAKGEVVVEGTQG